MSVRGAIDLTTAHRVHDEIQRHDEQALVIDLCRCDFIDSTGIGIILRRHRSAPDLTRVAAAAGGAAADTLAITLHRLIAVDPSVSAAVAALTGTAGHGGMVPPSGHARLPR